MPIYEYRCRKCGQTIEVMQRMNARPLRKCRNCSGRLEKLISRSSFALKGGGWYSEGYQNGNSKANSGSTSTPATKTEKKKKTAAA